MKGKEVFGLNIIQEYHKVNAVLSEDSKLRRKKTIDRKLGFINWVDNVN